MNNDSDEFHHIFGTSLENWMRTKTSSLPQDVVSAYLAAAYDVYINSEEKITLKIGEYSEGILDILKEYNSSFSAFITPCNPLGDQLTDAENERRCSDYEDQLAREGFSYLLGLGRDESGSWPGERSYFIPLIEREKAISYGMDLKQNAIVTVSSQGVPELVLLR